jgi:hypothetical protein
MSDKPKADQQYVVLAQAKDGKWKPVGQNKAGQFGIVADSDDWAHKDHPGIRPLKKGARERIAWCKKHGKKWKVMKVGTFVEHHMGGDGKLTLRAGAHWPTDKRTVERLKAVAADLGVEVRIISGLRTYAEQVALWNAYQAGRGNLAARPGTSNHERGHAPMLTRFPVFGSTTSVSAA